MKVHPQRDRQHNNLYDKLRSNHPVEAKDQIHHNQQRDIQSSLPAGGENGRQNTFPHSLQSIAD